MTSSSFFVLTLALVCSIFGSASEQTADPTSEHAMHSKHLQLLNKMDPIIKNQHTRTWTNIDNILEHNINSKHFNIKDRIEKKNNKFDEIFTVDVDNNNKFLNNNNEETRTDFFNNNKKQNEHVTFINVAEESSQSFYMNFRKKSTEFFLPSISNKRVRRQEPKEDKCAMFTMREDKIHHPHDVAGKNKNYFNDTTCVYVIEAKVGQTIKLTFVDVFHIETHPTCDYDFLEIRDGREGYAKLWGRYCGEIFPPQLSSSGPYMWLKFHSDETIEYEGFTIKVEIKDNAISYKIPDTCYIPISGTSGEIDSAKIDDDCKKRTEGHPLDVLWTITTSPETYIFLNFTYFHLGKPNECEENVVQVFSDILEDSARLQHYCGLIANPVSTKDATDKMSTQGNKMHVRMFASQNSRGLTSFTAKFVAFRILDPTKNEACRDEEFNCEDNTCIALDLKCNQYADCRLKADEENDDCKDPAESKLKETHVLVILVIFSLILSAMSFVFLFKCIRKLYQDHKIIKKHISDSCEDRLDDLITDSRLMLDAGRLQRESEPRASLERDNHTNELYGQQRSASHRKKTSLLQQTSIELEYQETRIDLEDEPWQRKAEASTEPQDVRAERNGRTRRSDTSRKEESLKSRKESVEKEDKKEIRDAAVGAPDTKESGCQTRESLFQTDTAPSSDGSNSNSNSRGFSTFGYSGATLARPSPPAAPAPAPLVSSAHIELLRTIPTYSQTKQKKMSDRRPMSAETTRSAPDVIIVSKPIR